MRIYTYVWGGDWINVERATPKTRREDQRIWKSQRTTEEQRRLKQRVENAGYRSTFLVPTRRKFTNLRGRVPMFSYMMHEILAKIPRDQRSRSIYTINNKTQFIGKNFNNLNSIRNIPINKRVYLEPDVNANGKIKHVYNSDGLVQWIKKKRGQATSPFTRRKITMNNVRTLVN
jgi:hypothetical protein